MTYPDLRKISWLVSEAEYRADHALSYSTLSTFERTGFNGLSSLFEAKSSSSLTLGSMVDAMITGGMDEFNERFEVVDLKVTDSGTSIVNMLVSMNLEQDDFNDIPQDVVSSVAKSVGFWATDKYDSIRYSKVLGTGNVRDLYNVTRNCSHKEIVTTDSYQTALSMVEALKTSEATMRYFADNDELSPVQRYYQLKFKMQYNNVVYRSMLDLIVVDHEKKVIYPIDLKTSSHKEWDFEESFMQWRYDIQARLYWRNLKANLDRDPIFRSYKLADYKFIVVNPYTKTPLVWEFPFTQCQGMLTDEKGNIYRDPFDIGEELTYYLENRPQVPKNITMNEPNLIKCLKKK